MYKKNCCLNFEQQSLYELVRDVHLSQKSPFRFFNMKLFGKIIFSLTATLALVRAPTKDLLKQLNLSVGPGGGTQFCIQLLKNYTGVVDDIDNKPEENVKTLLNNWDENDIIESAEKIDDKNVRQLFKDIISYYNGAIWFWMEALPSNFSRKQYCNDKVESLMDAMLNQIQSDFKNGKCSQKMAYQLELDLNQNFKNDQINQCDRDLKKFGEDQHQMLSYALFKTKPSRYSNPYHYALKLFNDISEKIYISRDFMVRINKICENQIIENPANMIQEGNQLHDVNSTVDDVTKPKKKKVPRRFPSIKKTKGENKLVAITNTPKMKTNKFDENKNYQLSSKPFLEDVKPVKPKWKKRMTDDTLCFGKQK